MLYIRCGAYWIWYRLTSSHRIVQLMQVRPDCEAVHWYPQNGRHEHHLNHLTRCLPLSYLRNLLFPARPALPTPLASWTGMLSSSWSEVARRNAWTCMSCSTRATPQILIGNTRPHSPSSKHQRRHSSSKPLSPPKNDPRAISAPSEAPTDQKVSAIESPKRSSTRLRRKNKDTVREPITRHHATRVNLPSVSSTQHLHPLGALKDF